MKQLLIYILFPILLPAQETIDVRAFFELAQPEQQLLDLNRDESVKFPLIEEYEFRTRTQDFEFDKQNYLLRVSPSTPKKRKIQQELYDLLQEAPDKDGQEIFCERILELYEDWSALYIINEQRKVYTQLRSVYEDKQKVYDRMMNASKIDFDDLVKLEIDRNDTTNEVGVLSLEEDEIVYKYGINSVNFDFSGFINLEQIDDALASNDSWSLEADPDRVFEQQLLAKEIELEEAEKKQFFDFAEMRYEGPHNDLFRERISLGLGFRLPTSGNRLLKIQELQIEQDRVRLEEERRIQEKEQDIERRLRQLEISMLKYRGFNIEQFREFTNMEAIKSQVTRQAGYSPIVLLNIEERRLKLQLKELRLYSDVLDDYLDYLFEADQLCSVNDGSILLGL